MQKIQRDTIMKAIKAIEVCGAKVCVKFPDGEVIGDLITLNKKPSKHMKDRFKGYDVRQRLEKMKEGEVMVFEILPNTPVTIAHLQSNVCGWGVQIFGKGNFTTTRNNGKVEALRIA